MKTRYFVLFVLGSIGAFACAYLGGAVAIGLAVVMFVAMFIVLIQEVRDEDRPSLRRKNPMLASEAIMHDIDGTGTGWELDDLMTWSPTPEQQEKAIRPLLEINDRYRSAEYPIGTSNPAAHPEMRDLAERLRSMGL